MARGDARVLWVVAFAGGTLLGCPKPPALVSPAEARARVEAAVAAHAWVGVESDATSECARVGGHWQTFGTTAADTCYAWLSGDDGGDAMTPSCDCGTDRCWLSGPERATCIAHTDVEQG